MVAYRFCHHLIWSGCISFPIGLCSFLVALGQCCGATLAILVVEKFGRRLLLIASEFCVTLSITALGAYFYAKENASVTCAASDVRSTKIQHNWRSNFG